VPELREEGHLLEGRKSGEMVCSNCGFVPEREGGGDGAFVLVVRGSAQQISSGPPTSIAQPDMGLDTVIAGREGTRRGARFPLELGPRLKGCASGTGGASRTSPPTAT